MPNWCINNLSVYGNAETLEKFVFANMGLPAQYLPIPSEKEDCLNGQEKHNNEYFCFNALVPTPKEILDIGFDGHEKIPADVYYRLIRGEKVSPIDGYHWSIQNWGTKWDIYYDEITPELMGWTKGCEFIRFDFDTAWSPPCEWLKQVVKMFPSLSFKLHYEEPGCYFAGDVYGISGRCIFDNYDMLRCAKTFQCFNEDVRSLKAGTELLFSNLLDEHEEDVCHGIVIENGNIACKCGCNGIFEPEDVMIIEIVNVPDSDSC